MAKENQANYEQSQEVNDAQMTAEQEAQAKAELIKEHNLRFYTEGCEVPGDALKTIRAGRLKGMSDVNPMWRMKRMTEIFGPVGFGWKYEILKQWTETYGNEVKCFCNVLLYVRDPETKEWSAPIPGNGGSAIVSQERNGPYVNDESYKMALTDALSIAMKPLGIGGNVWYGPKASGHYESKYEADTRDDKEGRAQMSDEDFKRKQLEQAINEINATRTEADLQDCWFKWKQIDPSITQNGTDLYKAACDKINAINNRPSQ